MNPDHLALGHAGRTPYSLALVGGTLTTLVLRGGVWQFHHQVYSRSFGRFYGRPRLARSVRNYTICVFDGGALLILVAHEVARGVEFLTIESSVEAYSAGREVADCCFRLLSETDGAVSYKRSGRGRGPEARDPRDLRDSREMREGQEAANGWGGGIVAGEQRQASLGAQRLQAELREAIARGPDWSWSDSQAAAADGSSDQSQSVGLPELPQPELLYFQLHLLLTFSDGREALLDVRKAGSSLYLQALALYPHNVWEGGAKVPPPDQRPPADSRLYAPASGPALASSQPWAGFQPPPLLGTPTQAREAQAREGRDGISTGGVSGAGAGAAGAGSGGTPGAPPKAPRGASEGGESSGWALYTQHFHPFGPYPHAHPLPPFCPGYPLAYTCGEARSGAGSGGVPCVGCEAAGYGRAPGSAPLPMTVRYFSTKSRILKIVCGDCVLIYTLARVKGYQNSLAYGWTLLNAFLDRRSVERALGASRSGRQRFDLELNGATANCKAGASSAQPWAPFSVSLLGPYILVWYRGAPDPEHVRVYDPRRNTFLEAKIHQPSRQLCEALVSPLAASSSCQGPRKTLTVTTPGVSVVGVRFSWFAPCPGGPLRFLLKPWLFLYTVLRVLLAPYLYVVGFLARADVRFKRGLYLTHGPIEELVTNGYRDRAEGSEDGGLLFNSVSEAPGPRPSAWGHADPEGGSGPAWGGFGGGSGAFPGILSGGEVPGASGAQEGPGALGALDSRIPAAARGQAGDEVETNLLALRRDFESLRELVTRAVVSGTVLPPPGPFQEGSASGPGTD